MSNLLHGLIYVFLIPLLISASPNYYWREYTFGEIPEDAVIGGQNKNGDYVYIGQVYVRPNTLLVAQINPGVKEAVVWTNNREQVVDKHIKILCGSQKNFVWFFNTRTEANDAENTILGGHKDSKKVLIRRFKLDGKINIGSIYEGYQCQWGEADPVENYIACVYEVLLYQETTNTSIWEAQSGYYWREYDGTIPVDALPGGTDINRKNIFIGQANSNDGLVVVRIVPGLTEVEGPMNGAKIDKFIKILCGNPKNFEWVSTTVSTIEVSLIDKYAVIGGHIDSSGYVCIGRKSSCFEIKIGMITCCDEEKNMYPLAVDSSVYQVLTEK